MVDDSRSVQASHVSDPFCTGLSVGDGEWTRCSGCLQASGELTTGISCHGRRQFVSREARPSARYFDQLPCPDGHIHCVRLPRTDELRGGARYADGIVPCVALSGRDPSEGVPALDSDTRKSSSRTPKSSKSGANGATSKSYLLCTGSDVRSLRQCVDRIIGRDGPTGARLHHGGPCRGLTIALTQAGEGTDAILRGPSTADWLAGVIDQEGEDPVVFVTLRSGFGPIYSCILGYHTGARPGLRPACGGQPLPAARGV